MDVSHIPLAVCPSIFTSYFINFLNITVQIIKCISSKQRLIFESKNAPSKRISPPGCTSSSHLPQTPMILDNGHSSH